MRKKYHRLQKVRSSLFVHFPVNSRESNFRWFEILIRDANAKLSETIEDNCSTLLRPKLDTKVTRKVSPYLFKTYVPSCKKLSRFGLIDALRNLCGLI